MSAPSAAPRTIFHVAPFGVYRVNPATGQREAQAVQLTQVLPGSSVDDLALLPADPTAPHYGAAIRAELAAMRKTRSLVWGPV